MLPGKDKYFTIPIDNTSSIKIYYINTNLAIFFANILFIFLQLGLIPMGLFEVQKSVGFWVLLLLPIGILILIFAFVPYKLRVTFDNNKKTVQFCSICLIPKIYENSSNTYGTDEIQSIDLEKFENLGKRYYAVYVLTKTGKKDKIIYGQDTSCSTTFDPWLDEITINIEKWLQENK